MTWVLVFLGGGLGSLCRFGLSMLLNKQSAHFPWATLTANFLSIVLLGLFVFVASQKWLDNHLKIFLITGFCGGFSTFSTFSMETLQLLQTNVLLGLANVLISVVGGIGILWMLSMKF